MLRVSRLESAGGVREADRLVASNSDIAEAFGAAMERYRMHRESLMPAEWNGPTPSGGIAGSKGGVKCLHAQYADTMSGNENPIGSMVLADVGNLDCSVPCVVEDADGWVRNEAWMEPS